MRYLSLKVAFWVDEVLDVPARSVISPATRRTLPAIWAVLIASLIAAFAMVANPAQASPENPAQDEAAYVAAINQVRRDAGVAPLVVDGELTSLSRGWAQQMANDGKISHASHPSDGISRYWLKVGENVGTGPDVSSIMAAFVASPGHYKNIVDPDFKYIGVGVVYSGPAMYTTHRFMKLDEPPPPPPTTPAAPEVTAPVATAPRAPVATQPPVQTTAPRSTATVPPTTVAPPPPPSASPVRIATLLTALRNSTI